MSAMSPDYDSTHEVSDFHPETGHLHTCDGQGSCGCAAALYRIAEDATTALSRIIGKHRDTTKFWWPRNPNAMAAKWRDGFVTGLATCSIIASDALHAGPDEATWEAASGTDREWFDATGNCGHCGNQGRYCVCGPDDRCGCGPHELATEPELCRVCKGRGFRLLPSEVVAARVGRTSAARPVGDAE